MTLDWIFFDAGNTLIGLNYGLLISALRADGFAVEEMTLRRAEVSARRDLDRAILERWRGGELPRTGWIEEKVWRAFWRQVLEISGADPWEAEDLVSTVLRVTRPASSWDRVEAGTEEALRELARRGYRLGIISNSSGTLAEHLRRLGLAGRFEVIVDSHLVGVEKPHPEIFHLAARRAGADDVSRALYVGDVYAIDVLGAAGAGMHAMLFDPLDTWDPSRLPQGAPVCRTLRSLGQLPATLDRAVRSAPKG